MKYEPIVKSLLDTDLYKFSMGQCYHHQFGNMKATWDFRARNVGIEKDHEPYTAEDIAEITEQIKAYCNLRFAENELNYLKTRCPWIHNDYINFLRFWHPVFEDFEPKSAQETRPSAKTHTKDTRSVKSFGSFLKHIANYAK